MSQEKKVDGSRPLKNARHEKFCLEYLIDLNGAQAAIRAGYAEGSAAVTASQFLTKPNISARVEWLKQEQFRRLQMTSDEILAELAIIGRSDIADYIEVDEDVGTIRVKGLKSVPRHLRRAIREVKEDRVLKETGSGEDMLIHDKLSIKLHPKVQALNILAKHKKLFADFELNQDITYEVSDDFMPQPDNDLREEIEKEIENESERPDPRGG